MSRLTFSKKPLSDSLNGYVPPLHGIDALQIAAPKHNVRNARAVPMLRCKYIDNISLKNKESAVRGWAAPIATEHNNQLLFFQKKFPLTSSRPMHIPCTSHKGIQTPYTKCQPSSNLTQLGNSIKGKDIQRLMSQ